MVIIAGVGLAIFKLWFDAQVDHPNAQVIGVTEGTSRAEAEARISSNGFTLEKSNSEGRVYIKGGFVIVNDGPQLRCSNVLSSTLPDSGAGAIGVDPCLASRDSNQPKDAACISVTFTKRPTGSEVVDRIIQVNVVEVEDSGTEGKRTRGGVVAAAPETCAKQMESYSLEKRRG
ncbi:hypothetical protein [Azospirillum picis]|uniref:Uncharacterized protein n=1 Tax=Azospirillum picis TaxID=488438 RepID=A0ABU0MP67_9PROT|nr:hypothetical protein [Azospirillum picis]MBP2301437.1 hypothetical protein [Azospirillum picis]MDQ0535269.1 hypothetical protein [Azospirillum picis]